MICSRRALGTALCVSLAVSVNGCGGGTGSTPGTSSIATQPIAGAATAGPSTSAPLTLTIRIPADTGVTGSSAERSPAYISTAVASVDFRLTAVSPTGGGTYSGTLPSDTLVPIGYNTGNCSLVASVETCTATTSAPAPATDTWTIYTYATTTPAVGTTTPLSVYAGYSLATTLAGPNNAVVATWGIPSSLVFSPATVNNVANNSALSGASALTTSLQVQDAGGATLIGGNNFASVTGTAGNVTFTGCGTHLTPTPGSITAANPAALGAGSISVTYDGLGGGGTTLNCYASAVSGLGPAFTEYATTTPSSSPFGVVSGPDGNIWFTESAKNKVGKMTPAGTMLAEYTPTSAGSTPFSLVAGPDGNLWFIEYGASNIAKITTSGTVTEYPTVPGSSQPFGITVGPDGELWFTEQFYSKVGKITTSGVETVYTVPTGTSGPQAITLGPDGDLWFTENGASKIAKVTTSGTFTEYATPTSASHPAGIANGPDGNLWFTENTASKIGKVTTSGTFTEYAIPTFGSEPVGIVAGPDGNMWFTEANPGNGKIGMTTTAGVMTEYTIPSVGGGPEGITVGPDSNLWFAEFLGSNIAKLVIGGGPLTAEFYVNLVAGTGSDNWTVTSKARHQ